VILIVDDHPITLQVVARLLRSRGHDARTAPSGHAALHILSQIRPSLIILDICMPDIDGLAILRILRHDRRYVNTNVIAFTASSELGEQALASGAQAVFVKGDLPLDSFLAQVDMAAWPVSALSASATTV
jgi:CheY-like chemotaxis protein